MRVMAEGELFGGHFPRECGEHRTAGPHRAWCHDCGEWCYPDDEMACKGCRIPVLEARAAALVAAEHPQPEPRRYTFTRDQLTDALTRLDVRVLTSGPCAGMVNAESMADCIIEALETERRRAFRAGVREDAGKIAAREGSG
jgi:hypothetical protein